MEAITLDELRARKAALEQAHKNDQQLLREIQERLPGYRWVLSELQYMIEDLEQRIAAREQDEQQLALLEADAGIAQSVETDTKEQESNGTGD